MSKGVRFLKYEVKVSNFCSFIFAIFFCRHIFFTWSILQCLLLIYFSVDIIRFFSIYLYVLWNSIKTVLVKTVENLAVFACICEMGAGRKIIKENLVRILLTFSLRDIEVNFTLRGKLKWTRKSRNVTQQTWQIRRKTRSRRYFSNHWRTFEKDCF